MFLGLGSTLQLERDLVGLLCVLVIICFRTDTELGRPRFSFLVRRVFKSTFKQVRPTGVASLFSCQGEHWPAVTVILLRHPHC